MKPTLSILDQNGGFTTLWQNFSAPVRNCSSGNSEYLQHRDEQLKLYHATFQDWILTVESEEYMTLFLLKYS
jgi:hypothetical protein